MKIGVLALQGGFAKHIEVLKSLGINYKEIRLSQDMNDIDALILPGGESTTNIKLMNSYELYSKIQDFSSSHPLFGTCAGSILMGKQASNFPYQTLNLIDAFVERNAYGTQVDSFIDDFDFLGKRIEAMFIRAPKFKDIGDTVKVLSYHNGDPVIIHNDEHLMATCHPELTRTTDVHQFFIETFLK
jgi:pyridoxal 5'-phosphate synthase pdxT subunit